MGHFRFHRSIGNKFFRLNISKSGFSVSGGVPGAHINVPIAGRRKRSPMGTLGIPGTGLSYRQRLGGGPGRGVGNEGYPMWFQVLAFFIGAIVLTIWYLS